MDSRSRPVRVDPLGLAGPTKAQASGPRWRRTSLGFYVPAEVSDDLPEQRILEQSMRLPEGGAVTGWAACRLLGATFFDGLGPDGGMRLPVPLWVGGLAQLTRDEAVDPTATVLLDTVGGVRGVSLVRAAVGLASEDSRSPGETRTRLVWVLDAGLPTPLVNQPVFDRRGNLLGIADLLDPEAGVVGEYDGADHRAALRHSKDVDREARLRDVGLEVFRVAGPDLRDPQRLVRRMLGARRRARWLAPGRRVWTLEPPEDWPLELPLHDRLEQRAAHERWERDRPDAV